MGRAGGQPEQGGTLGTGTPAGLGQRLLQPHQVLRVAGGQQFDVEQPQLVGGGVVQPGQEPGAVG